MHKRSLSAILGLLAAGICIFLNAAEKKNSVEVLSAQALPFLTENFTVDQAEEFANTLMSIFIKDLNENHLSVEVMVNWANERFDARMAPSSVDDGVARYTLHLSRGLYIKSLTTDAVALSISHELGHLLGQGPRTEFDKTTPEGEADYYATNVGMKRILAAEVLPESLRRLEFKERIANVILEVTHNMARINKEPILPRIETPDPIEVSATRFGYPSMQCRLDTMMAGLNNLSRPKCWALAKDFLK